MVQFRPPTSGSNETSSTGLARPQADAAIAPATGSWRERYSTGSWRGVEFLTERHDKEGGRRVVTHEFPQRDEPWSEDLGRRARRWTIDCLVIGSTYMAQRDALEAALELAGGRREVQAPLLR